MQRLWGSEAASIRQSFQALAASLVFCQRQSAPSISWLFYIAHLLGRTTPACLTCQVYIHSKGVVHKDLKGQNLLLLHDTPWPWRFLIHTCHLKTCATALTSTKARRWQCFCSPPPRCHLRSRHCRDLLPWHFWPCAQYTALKQRWGFLAAAQPVFLPI